MKKDILAKIESRISYNNSLKSPYGSACFNKAMENNNELLYEIIDIIKESKNEYSRGLEDAWSLAQKIGGCYCDDKYYDSDELFDIFGYCDVEDIFNHLSYTEALEKLNAYEKKKEAAKPKIGDVIEVIGYCPSFQERGIFLSAGRDGFTYVNANGTVVSAGNDYFEIKKTGEHVNILRALGKE